MFKACLFAGLALSLPLTANALSVTKLSSYTEECGGEESCSEIAAFDETSSRIFVTNAAENELRILSLDNNLLQEFQVIDLSGYGGGPNSVDVSNGIVAVAVEAHSKTDNGSVVLFEYDINLGTYTEFDVITAGALPDMLTFTPDGNYLLVANEGEPNDDYTIDPEGSVSVIRTSDWSIQHADFNGFNLEDLKNVRVFGPGASLQQDLEPEYIATSADSRTAWVSLQENNALAKLDIASATITDIYGLGYKTHHQTKNAFDASNEDGGINIQTWPTFGMYQPDAIATYQRGKATFIITANEGDARDYDGFSEEARVKDLTLDPEVFPSAAELQQDENLGRLKTTTTLGDIDNDGDYDEIYSYGARSFSIWNANGKRVYDSGQAFERALANYATQQGMDVWEDGRSDDKGPEPESVTVGQFGDDTLAFIGLERTSGIFIYQLNNPRKPEPVAFIDVEDLGDEGPEGLVYIERDANTGWLLVTSEISNTISLYEITP
jgi:DNA-binding beta-propeller fold protein YncE